MASAKVVTTKVFLIFANSSHNDLRKSQKGRDKSHSAEITHASIDMSWYDSWLSQQLKNVPRSLLQLRVGTYSFSNPRCLETLFEAIEDCARGTEGVSVDEMTAYLRETGVFDYTETLEGDQKLLVFAVLGWRSMLYQAAFNVCSTQELAIHQDSGQPQSGLVFDTHKISAELSDRPLSVLLKAFGQLLPARSSGLSIHTSELGSLASLWQPLHPEETNAYLLHVLLRVQIRWVDVLSLHLDYDKTTRTLSLFRYPSFCLEALRSRGLLYSFSSIESFSADPRANEEDISQFLLEVLLSYRLLFAQSAPSRKLFRQMFIMPDMQCQPIDSLLFQLCTLKRISQKSTLLPTDRPLYFAARDFPILYDRIELIAKDLKGARPKSFIGLIRDRRDVLQYWTFWLVSIIGGMSILLSLIQVILQGLSMM
ncbi:hypothetical protein N7452_005461 [Penicillium brevicompactum]|uniref:Uncharacterized protein n=1 Tax=Penicillium brevicompactum TaxID=5074 RepID=A0A9W9UF45_PENBR|nr:hypothetical protein N7452_005461 [Penicillium brevicompactum]